MPYDHKADDMFDEVRTWTLRKGWGVTLHLTARRPDDEAEWEFTAVTERDGERSEPEPVVGRSMLWLEAYASMPPQAI